MSGNPIKDLGTIGGGVAGFFVGGPQGALMGASLGSSLGQVISPDKPKALPEMETAGKPPTPYDASLAAKKSEMLKKKTYGSEGTIRNVGGSRGVASSLLNISSPSLIGQ